jgi:hypothetical protein
MKRIFLIIIVVVIFGCAAQQQPDLSIEQVKPDASGILD